MSDENTPPLILHSPAGEELLVRNMTFVERVSEPFEVHLELLSIQREVEPDELLGVAVDVEIIREGFDSRFVNGILTQFELVGVSQSSGSAGMADVLSYSAVLRPWMWLLTRSHDCRIFQEMTVPDIIQEVFGLHGFSDFELDLYGSYDPRVYCVQYRESAFNFVSRLMEEEGLYYYFKHEQGKHTLVITDNRSSHEPLEGFEELVYNPTGERDVQHEDNDDEGGSTGGGIISWRQRKTLRSGSTVLSSFDFTNINKDLVAPHPDPEQHAHGEYEVFDYDARYLDKGHGESYAKLRVEAMRSARLSALALTGIRQIEPGRTFTLVDHPAASQNKEYLIVSATHRAGPVSYSTAAGEAPFDFKTEFEALDHSEQYRPMRKSPLPQIRGPQTAIVTGPAGQEIYCDEHGRVKVHFHWDRHNPPDDTSSCWIRVNQNYAGQSWGSMTVPRIGQEVIVEHEDSDPDRPLITGRVYNGNNKPPYGLPGSKAVSGLKSNSTPGGGGYNEISMDDTKGDEKITIHGQHNMSTTVLNDETAHIQNNRTVTVDVDHTETVGANQKVDIGADQAITVGGNRTDEVAADETRDIGANETVTVGADRSITVGSNRKVAVGSDDSLEAGSNISIAAGSKFTTDSGADTEITAGANFKTSSSANTEINAGAEMKITAAAKITLSAGGSTIEIGPAGVTITAGAMVTINGAMVKLNC